MSITQEELAKKLNLHRGSVARILAGKGGGYSEQTRRRVLELAAELGYQPNSSARALKTGATQIVALCLLSHDTYSPYFSYVQYWFQRLGIQRGYQLITQSVLGNTETKVDYSQLVRWRVDGILSFNLNHVVDASAHFQMQRSCPIVYLGQGYVPDGTDCLQLDLYSGAREAIAHLLSAGCQRLVYVCPSYVLPDVSLTDMRTRAYVDLLQEAGKPIVCAPAEDTRSGGYLGLQNYVAEHGVPDGLFCINDEVAIGCYLALQELGVRVPDDVLLVGCDGLDNARLFSCPISSVVIPVEEMCTLAWDMLLARLRDPQAPLQHRTLVPHLEIRASSLR